MKKVNVDLSENSIMGDRNLMVVLLYILKLVNWYEYMVFFYKNDKYYLIW